MKNFSQIVNTEKILQESRDSVQILQSEITNYIRKVNRVIPNNIKDIISLTQKYDITTSEDLDKIRLASKGQLPTVAKELNIPEDGVILLYDLLKKAGKNIRMIPHYQSRVERNAIIAGQLAMDDLTIDLETNAGRNAAAKIYTPLVLKIANQYVGKTRLDKASLISAGAEGLSKAMNDWNKEGKEGKKTTFRTYASYRIAQSILDEINTVGHTFSGTNWYNTEKLGAAMLDAVSLDGMVDQDDDFKQDHLAALGSVETVKDYEGEQKNWQEIYKMIEDKFPTRDVDIFYRYFGLGPYYKKRQKVKDIAKEFGMSDGNIQNSIISKILKFLRTNHKAMSLISDIRDTYTESLLSDMVLMGKEYVLETLYSDRTFIMLEEVARWSDKKTLEDTVASACKKLSEKECEFIILSLSRGMEYLLSHLQQNRKTLVYFLNEIYPTENFSRKKDSELAEYVEELITATKMLSINW